MKLDELISIAMGNLWRTRLRTVLTLLGVVIGIGALVSMISFGLGMQKNVTEVFYENDLFTSMFVSSQRIDAEQALSGNIEGMMRDLYEPPPVLDDSVLNRFGSLPGVETAFPEIRFPVKIRYRGHHTNTDLQAIPPVMGKYKPFTGLEAGRFFDSDTAREVILSVDILKDLNIRLRSESLRRLTLEDSLRQTLLIEADSLIGDSLEIITSVVDMKRMSGYPGFFMQGRMRMPFREISNRFEITGVVKAGRGFRERTLLSGAVIPIGVSGELPRIGFNSIWDVLGGKHNQEGYGSAIVRVQHIDHIDSVKAEVERMGFSVFSVMDQLSEMKKGFLVFDMGLGAIGTIALIVAALGIINTMVMSILERTKEIGIMKAIGGSEDEIRTIFFVEAGMIGLLGGLFGLVLGWLVTRLANAVANVYFLKEMDFTVNFFHFPAWLILSAVVFSIGMSLLAGLYPASRAARIDPVEALRHD